MVTTGTGGGVAGDRWGSGTARQQGDGGGAPVGGGAEDGDVRRGDVVGVGGVVASIPIWIEGVRGEWGEWGSGEG